MAVVGAGDHVLFAQVLQDVGQVLVSLTRDEEPVLLEVRRPEFRTGDPQPTVQEVDEVRDPRRIRLDEPPPQVGEALRDLAAGQVVERHDRQQPHVREHETEAAVEELRQHRRAGAGVDADGQVQSLGLLVDREEVRLRQRAVLLDALEEHPTRPILLAEVHLLDTLVEVAQRRNNDPPHTSTGAGARVGHEPVVAPRQRHLQFHVMRQKPDKQRGIDDLHVDAHVRRVVQACVDVGHRALVPRGRVAYLVFDGRRRQRLPALARRVRHEMAVDDPEVADCPVIRIGAGDQLGLAVRHLLVEEVPDALRLDHVRVSVDHRCHPTPPPCSLAPSSQAGYRHISPLPPDCKGVR